MLPLHYPGLGGLGCVVGLFGVNVVPEEGLEPSTLRLKAAYSAS